MIGESASDCLLVLAVFAHGQFGREVRGHSAPFADCVPVGIFGNAAGSEQSRIVEVDASGLVVPGEEAGALLM